MRAKLKLLSIALFIFTSCKPQEKEQVVAQIEKTEELITRVEASIESSSEQNTVNLPKVENKIEGELDYAKNELQLSFVQYNREETLIGKIAKDGSIQFNLPDINLKSIYKEINMGSASLESLFEMSQCKGDTSYGTKHEDIYSQKYNIGIKLYGITVATLIPVSDEEVFKNLISDDHLKYIRGSKYSFYNIDQDVNFNLECKQNDFEGIYDIELNRIAKIPIKKGWNLIRETIEQTQQYTKGEFTKVIPKEITYTKVDFADAGIKWYINKKASEDEILLIKKLFHTIPITKEVFTSWAPKKLVDLPLTAIEYGKPPKNETNKNNIHLVFSNEHQKRDIELYVIDCAKNAEDLLMTNNVYAMEAEYGENKDKRPKPYVAQYNEEESTTKLLYKVNNRIVVNATGFNIKPEELWKYIQQLKVEQLIK